MTPRADAVISAGIRLSRAWVDVAEYERTGKMVPTGGPVTRKEAIDAVQEMFDQGGALRHLDYDVWALSERGWKLFIRDVIKTAKRHGLRIEEDAA